GGCHCKKVRYEFEHPEIYAMPVMNCNCSIYEARGHLLVRPPLLSSFLYIFNSYEFRQYVVTHRFCLTCGTSMGLVGAPGGPFDGLVVVNARTIDGVDLDRLELR
ncbi:hypothetical protein B0H14DRAFT_2326236, partial [Mycena olivaceomarginata]